MTTIDDIVFLFVRYFKTVNTINDKVDNCAYASIAIFIVNFSVLFLFTNEKALNIKKIIAMQMFFRLQSEHEVFFLRLKVSFKGDN